VDKPRKNQLRQERENKRQIEYDGNNADLASKTSGLPISPFQYDEERLTEA
jgi:hypothetical protein